MQVFRFTSQGFIKVVDLQKFVLVCQGLKIMTVILHQAACTSMLLILRIKKKIKFVVYFSYSGVRISGFLNEEEKKYQQKSIVHFLEPGQQASLPRLSPRKSSSENVSKASERESFFNKKRVTRQQTSQRISTNEPSDMQNLQGIKPLPSLDQAEDIEHQIFVCPVCFEKHQDITLETFNRHIDRCLNETLEKDNKEITNDSKSWETSIDLALDSERNECEKGKGQLQVEVQSIDIISNSASSTAGKNSEYCSENENRLPVDSVCSIHSKQDLSSEVLSVKKEHVRDSIYTDIKSPCFSDSIENKILVCPVCNLEQKTRDLALFNRHVDVCLNKGIIKQLTENSKCVGEYLLCFKVKSMFIFKNSG